MPDIVLKNKNGEDVTYTGIETVTFDTPVEGEQVTYSYGTVEEKTIALDMASGNQEIIADEGKLLSKVTVEKPSELIASNIKKDVNIGGVVGNFIGNSEEKTVDLDFSNGDIEVTPKEDYLLDKVTINKPETLLPENIAKDVEIAGVVGTMTGGGLDDDFLKYFTYKINPNDATIILYSVDYEQIYADTGSYDVTIPDTIAGLNVIIKSN